MPAALAFAFAILTLQSAASRPQPAPTVQGEVLGQDGKPVAGAQVRIVRWDSGTLPAQMTWRLGDTERELTRIQTDTHGRFHSEVPEGHLLAAYATHATHATGGMSQAVTGFGPGDALVLRLLPTRRIAGKVLLRRGGATAPATDQPVWYRLVPRNLHRETPLGENRSLRLTTRTNAQGVYQLDVPDEGEDRPGVWTQFASQSAHGVDITQEREPIRVACMLVAKDTGMPVAGARAIPAWGDGVVPAVSDAAGRLETLSAESGTAQLVPAAHSRVILGPDRLRPVADGELARVELEPGLQVQARFVRADGTSLANARVLLSSAVMEGNTGWGAMEWSDATDAEGRLRIGCLQKDQVTTGFVELGGEWQLFLHRSLTADLDLGEIQTHGSARIDGRVVGPDGSPVAGAQVLLLPPRADQGRMGSQAPVRTVTANRLGQFAVSGLLPGTWQVAARSASLGLATATFDTTRPKPLLLALPAGAVVAGRVFDSDGKPLPRFQVQAWAHQTATRRDPAARFGLTDFRVETDAEGRFAVRGLPEGVTVQLNAYGRTGETSLSGGLRNVAAGSTDLELVLKRQ